MEVEGLLGSGLAEGREERAPKQPAEDPYREEEPLAAWDPGGPIQCQPPSRHQAMDVGMMVQGLAPGMQDPEEADLRAQVLGIPGNRLERCGHGLKQQRIDHPRMLQGERTQLGRKRKDHMAVGHVQELPLARGEPGDLGTALAFWTVPIAARVIADLLIATAVALRFVAAERGGPAGPDRLQDPALGSRRHRAIASQVGVAILPNNIRNFQQGARHGWPSRAGPRGKVSSGLGMTASAWGVTWR